MTDDRNQPFWERRPDRYVQQDVHQPALLQNPGNALLAIHHLGQWIDVEIYPTSNTWRTGTDDPIDDGRNYRGEPVVLTVYAVTYPTVQGDDNTITLPEGEHNEGMRTFVFDANQPENKEVAVANPSLFPNGYLHIAGADADGKEKTNNHAAIFRFNDQRWEVITSQLWNEARNEEVDQHGGCYVLNTKLYRHRSHERDARPTTTGVENDTYDEWKTS